MSALWKHLSPLQNIDNRKKDKKLSKFFAYNYSLSKK